MSIQLATRVVNVKDGDTYESLDMMKGDDGFSPEASVSKSGDTTTITITDKNGTTTAQVLDGTQITVDSAMSPTSENPVQNKEIARVVNNVVDYVTEAVSGRARTIAITDEYDPEREYYVGGLCMHDGKLYTCVEDITTPEEWNYRHWDSINLDWVLSYLFDDMATRYDNTATYAVGDYCIDAYGTLYRCITAITTPEEWNYEHWEEVNVGDELSRYNDDINHKQDAPSTLGTDGQIMGLAVINGQLVPVWINPLDVQINGTSIVNDGVANVPYADTSGTYGLIKTANNTYGLTIDNGYLKVASATSSLIKEGNDARRPIVSSNQHNSVFYGLAKAASDTTQSASSNPVGTYTDDAKIAIQKMLGIYEPPWELLNEITLDAIGGIDLTADSNGAPYNLLSVLIQVLYPANSASITSGYSRFRAYDANNNYVYVSTGRYQTATYQKYKLIHFKNESNMKIAYYTQQVSTGDGAAWYTKNLGSSGLYSSGGGASTAVGNITRIMEDSGDTEPVGTIFRIYGQRAY